MEISLIHFSQSVIGYRSTSEAQNLHVQGSGLDYLIKEIKKQTN